MNSSPVAVLFVSLLYISWSSQIESDVDSSAATTQERDSLARTANEFGYRLMAKLMTQNENKNIVISPSGIAGLMAMTLLGSTGTTYDELAKALGFSQDILTNRRNHEVFGTLLQEINVNPDPADKENLNQIVGDIPDAVHSSYPTSDSNTTVDANANVSSIKDVATRTLYADAIVVDAETRIRNVYRHYLERVYHGEAFITNFKDTMESQQLINDWVKNHTSGKIEDFLKEPLPVSTKVVLLSALYFSGQWARPFSPLHTKQMKFRTPNGDVEADLMLNLGSFNYTIEPKHGAHMIAIPYNDSTTTLYALKPIFPHKLNISQLLTTLDFATIEGFISNMKSQDCAIRFPKMDLKTKFNLKDSLNELGVNSMFTKDANFALLVDNNNAVVNRTEERALLSRIYVGGEESKRLKDAVDSLSNPGVFVDAVLHDVKMTINEYGTVAVAATSGLLSRSAKMFYADSPFFIFIRNEKTKLVTFSAVIYDPTEL